MDQKMKLIGDWLKKEYSIIELSQNYGVSRKTIYKWIKRYESEGASFLEELSRAPHRHPNATDPEIVNKLLATKVEHEKWGPKKVVAWLAEHDRSKRWPVPSTVQSIFKKEGLIQARSVRRHCPPYQEPFKECLSPNAVWSMDYKGQFRMQNRQLCYPFTLTDNYSRFLLGCDGLLHPTYEATRRCLERAFQEYGLPQAIRNDNGAPFASVAVGGLSALSIWLIKLQIRPERIKAGHPEQNGRHERMHRSLKEATAQPPKANLVKQQAAFDHFRYEFDYERPHEALGQAVPAAYYHPSRRLLPHKLPEVEYAGCYTVREVRSNGEIRWKGGKIYVCEALAGEPVGLMQVGNDEWEVKFSFHSLGILDEKTNKIKPLIRGREV